MKFRDEYIPELAAGDDSYREALKHVLLDVERKRLVSTNGHLMAFVPCEVSALDVGGLIPVAAIEYAREAAKQAGKEWIEIGCFDRCVCDGASFDRPTPEEPFPDLGRAALAPALNDPSTLTFALDARYLIRLARSLGEGKHKGPAPVVLTVKLPTGDAPMHDAIRIVCNQPDMTGERAR